MPPHSPVPACSWPGPRRAYPISWRQHGARCAWPGRFRGLLVFQRPPQKRRCVITRPSSIPPRPPLAPFLWPLSSLPPQQQPYPPFAARCSLLHDPTTPLHTRTRSLTDGPCSSSCSPFATPPSILRRSLPAQYRDKKNKKQKKTGK